jgi:EAL domain-containing protein (putative c-di-GMP-specific phosphodiesterase class I)
VVGQALRLLGAGRAVAINVSGDSVDDPRLTDMIERGLAQPGVNADDLTIELTETASVASFDAARSFNERLRRLGCRFALDDFGTGFGTLTYLRGLDFQYLKIDRQFVTGLSSSRADQRIVRSVVGIARSLGVTSVAEGIEDAGTAALLRQYGVDRAQGLYFGRPAPAELPGSL